MWPSSPRERAKSGGFYSASTGRGQGNGHGRGASGLHTTCGQRVPNGTHQPQLALQQCVPTLQTLSPHCCQPTSASSAATGSASMLSSPAQPARKVANTNAMAAILMVDPS